MARPSNALRTATTTDGTRFQWDVESLRSAGARDASREEVLVIVGEGQRDQFLKEAVGFTVATRDTPTGLRRTLPLRHPKRAGFYCETYDLVDYGAYETRSDFGDPLNNEAPAQDWYRYNLTFVKPKGYKLFTEAQLADPGLFGVEINREQYRYTRVTYMPRPRERRVSGLAYQYQKPDGTWATIPDESQFIPDYQIDIVVTWLQVPAGAIPWPSILDCGNCVNNNSIGFGIPGRTWEAESLLFKGMARPIEEYTAADDSVAIDLDYLFTVQPGTWNKYLTRDIVGNKDYRPTRINAGLPFGLGGGFPPYIRKDFQTLFTAV
jgi:hypothetical protein